jgi:hypothetical protein
MVSRVKFTKHGIEVTVLPAKHVYLSHCIPMSRYVGGLQYYIRLNVKAHDADLPVYLGLSDYLLLFG